MQKKQNFNRKHLLLIIIIIITLISLGLKAGNTKIALVMKVIQDVSIKTQNTEWRKADKADPLGSGDRVSTGKKSLAVIKFLDNSLLRVREQSQITITSDASGGGTIKEVNIINGSLGFDVKKLKQNDQFKFTSPTSVASIRGTKGKFGSGDNGDTVIVTDGIVNLKNKFSYNEIDLNQGFIGFSSDDGSVSSRKATEQELADANDTKSDNEINIEFKDTQGNKKDLKIKYKK